MWLADTQNVRSTTVHVNSLNFIFLKHYQLSRTFIHLSMEFKNIILH